MCGDLLVMRTELLIVRRALVADASDLLMEAQELVADASDLLMQAQELVTDAFNSYSACQNSY